MIFISIFQYNGGDLNQVFEKLHKGYGKDAKTVYDWLATVQVKQILNVNK